MTNNLFYEYSISDIHRGFRNKTIDPLDVAQACIDRYEQLDQQYHAWVCFNKDLLLEQAQSVKIRIERGESIRPLEGIPVGIKDIFNTIDFPTQMGSPLWKDFTPGNDARVVYNAKNAGCLTPGKTITAEFAVHTLNETLNPHNIDLTPGTSSSGSAVAVALGMVPVALGTQTAGSIVRPASFCGVYGCKPSFGFIPRTGMLKTTDSLDTIGYFSSKFNDLELLFDVLRVHGHNYPFSHKAITDNHRQSKPTNRPWRVALVRTHTWKYASNYAKDALISWAKSLSSHNIDIIEAELPEVMIRSHQVHEKIYDKTLSYYFTEEHNKKELVSPIMNEIIRRGKELPVADYLSALQEQETLCHAMDSFLQGYDAMISLSTADAAPRRGTEESPDPALMWTLTHLPVISAPIFATPQGLPFGAQLTARRFNDRLLFKFGAHLRSADLIPDSPHPLYHGAR